MPKNKNYIWRCFTLFSKAPVLRHFMAHNDSVLCCMNFCIDPIHFILPFNSTGMTAYTVHIHVFPLRLLKRCYTCTQRTQHLTFFFFGGGKIWLWWLHFVCMFVVTVNHAIIWGFCSKYTTVKEYHFHYSVLYVWCLKSCSSCIFICW